MSNNSIVGTWKLVFMEAKSSKGDAFFPYGENPAGSLIYSASGDMAVVLMRTGRPRFASGDPFGGTPEEIKQAFEGFDAYSGTYEVDMVEGAVTHQIEVARFPNWVGTEQIRYFDLSSNQLKLSTPPIFALDQEWVIDVVWQRKA